MNRYTFHFTGREIGAIGAFSEFTVSINAQDEHAARVAVYETHEHLSNVRVECTPIQTRCSQAITTRVLPCTNTKPTRIKAECARGSIVIGYHNPKLDLSASLGGDADRHVAAANALVAKFVTEDEKQYGSDSTTNPWNAPRFIGALKNGDYTHVFVS